MECRDRGITTADEESDPTRGEVERWGLSPSEFHSFLTYKRKVGRRMRSGPLVHALKSCPVAGRSLEASKQSRRLQFEHYVPLAPW